MTMHIFTGRSLPLWLTATVMLAWLASLMSPDVAMGHTLAQSNSTWSATYEPAPVDGMVEPGARFTILYQMDTRSYGYVLVVDSKGENVTITVRQRGEPEEIFDSSRVVLPPGDWVIRIDGVVPDNTHQEWNDATGRLETREFIEDVTLFDAFVAVREGGEVVKKFDPVEVIVASTIVRAALTLTDQLEKAVALLRAQEDANRSAMTADLFLKEARAEIAGGRPDVAVTFAEGGLSAVAEKQVDMDAVYSASNSADTQRLIFIVAAVVFGVLTFLVVMFFIVATRKLRDSRPSDSAPMSGPPQGGQPVRYMRNHRTAPTSPVRPNVAGPVH